jgi:hypothetical protein
MWTYNSGHPTESHMYRGPVSLIPLISQGDPCDSIRHLLAMLDSLQTNKGKKDKLGTLCWSLRCSWIHSHLIITMFTLPQRALKIIAPALSWTNSWGYMFSSSLALLWVFFLQARRFDTITISSIHPLIVDCLLAASAFSWSKIVPTGFRWWRTSPDLFSWSKMEYQVLFHSWGCLQ